MKVRKQYGFKGIRKMETSPKTLNRKRPFILDIRYRKILIRQRDHAQLNMHERVESSLHLLPNTEYPVQINLQYSNQTTAR